MQPPPSDAQLLHAFAGGDMAAFGELVTRHEAALLRHARAVLGQVGGHEDCVQEAFLRLAERPPELCADPHGAEGSDGRDPSAANPVPLDQRLSAWLHRVTRNAAMDLLRSEGRRRQRERSTTDPEPATTGGLPEVEAADTRAAVRRGLDDLPPDQREVLVLRLLDGKRYREIAAITGRPEGTVGWLVSTGLETLSRRLAPLFDTEARPQRLMKGGLS